MPEMTKVESRHVWEMGYDPETKELHVRFIPSVQNPEGRLVIYHEVGQETAIQLLSAPSPGTALNSLVKGRFEHR